MENKPQDYATWLRLGATDFDFLRAEEKAAVESAVRAWQFPQGECDSHDRATLAIIAHVLPGCSEEVQRLTERKFLEWIARMARPAAPHPQRPTSFDDNPTAMDYALLVLSFSHRPTVEETLAALAQLLTQIVRLWPAESGFWNAILERAMIGLSHRERESLWKSLIVVRSLA
jgi:hypothetical protein